MTERDSARQLGGALGWGITSRLARTLLGLFGTYLVLNMLTPREFGTLSLVRNFLAYLTIVVGAGLSQGLLRYLPAWRLSAGRSRMRMALFASFAVHVVLWALVTLILFLLKPWIGEVTNEVVAGLVVLGVALLLPEVFGHTATNIANAYYDTRNISVAVVITTITYVVALALLLKQGLGPSGVLIAAAISNVVLTLVLLSKVPRYLNQPAENEETMPTPPRVRTALRYSLPFVVIGILNLVTWKQSEVFILGYYHGPELAGFFDLAYRLPQTILEFIPGAIWPLVMAGSAEAFVRNPAALQRTTSAYYRLLFLLVTPLAVGGFLVGDKIIHHLGGGAYAAAAPFCQIFFVVMGFSFLATPLSMAFYVIERPWIGFWLYVLNSIINVGLDFLLIPRYGLWGAVIPVSIVIFMSPFLNSWVLSRLGVKIRPPFAFLSRIFMASAIMLALWPLRGIGFSIWGFVTLIVAGAILFFLGLRLFKVFGTREQELMMRSSPRVWGILKPLVVGSSRQEGE